MRGHLGRGPREEYRGPWRMRGSGRVQGPGVMQEPRDMSQGVGGDHSTGTWDGTGA